MLKKGRGDVPPPPLSLRFGPWNVIKKENLAQVIPYEILGNIEEHLINRTPLNGYFCNDLSRIKRSFYTFSYFYYILFQKNKNKKKLRMASLQQVVCL